MTTKLKHVEEGSPLRLHDTKWIQLESLDRFAKELGYLRNSRNSYFNPYNVKRITISFKGMSMLHNTNFNGHGVFSTVSSKNLGDIRKIIEDKYNGVFSKPNMLKAIEKKIVKCSKLEYDKRTKEILCNDNQISFK